VVVDDLDLAGVTVLEAEDDPELVVHSDAVEARAIALQGFQPVKAVAREERAQPSLAHAGHMAPPRRSGQRRTPGNREVVGGELERENGFERY